MKDKQRLSWTAQRPDWEFYPQTKFHAPMGGWFRTLYTLHSEPVWSLNFMGAVAQFRDVGSPSAMRH